MNTNAQFPYSGFPYKLEYLENKNKRICYFECKEHLDKYLTRSNLKKKDVSIEVNKKSNRKNSK